MNDLGDIPSAILTARVAKKRIDCLCRRPCCSKSLQNPTFIAPLNILADEIGPLLSFRRQYVGHSLRFDLIQHAFDTKNRELEALALAEKYGVSEDTIGKFNGKIKIWLFGHKVSKTNGVETDAWRDIESSLRKVYTNDGAPIVG